jgi:hypothetical protein
MNHPVPAQPIRILVFLLLASSLSGLAWAGEGFGMMKKTVKLTRVRPPEVFLPGERLGVRVKGEGNAASAAPRLKAQIESELLGKNARLKLDDGHPDATLEIAVLQNDYSERWEDRQMVRSVKTGQVDSKNRPIYRDEQITVRFKVVSYTFNTAFKVHDTRADKSLAADVSDWSYKKDFQDGNGSPDSSSLESNAVAYVVGDLTRRLAPTQEIIGVLLPKGSFENAGAFADAGLWSKYLESLEKIQPLKNPADEAYRQYGLGVAYEALGYGADDDETTLKYLEQASLHYNNAVDANPKEGYFTKPYQSLLFNSRSADAPLTRVSGALVQYQRMKEFKDATVSAQAGRGAKDLREGGAGAGDDRVTNQSVISMLRAGLSEQIILTSIASAVHPDFDVSPKGLIQLADAKASQRIIQRIQEATQKASDTPKHKTVRPKT